jgi:Tfp pilus assembly protein PilF
MLERLVAFRDLAPQVAEKAHARLGRIYLRLKAFSRARRHLTTALIARPESALHHYRLALALSRGEKRDPARASEHFQQSLDREPQQPACLIAFGRFCLANDRPEEGLGLLRRAIELCPDDVPALGRALRAMAGAGYMEEALDIARAARFRNPRHAGMRQLQDTLKYRQLLAEQKDQAKATSTAADPVILAFQRPAAVSPTVPPNFRSDGASILPSPHFGRGARRPDWKHG